MTPKNYIFYSRLTNLFFMPMLHLKRAHFKAHEGGNMLETLEVTDQAAQAIKDFLSQRKGPNAVRIFLSAG